MAQRERQNITFTTREQQILFSCELQGQISDGFWENSSPRNHYQQISAANVHLGEEFKMDFYPRRKYNFANKELVDCVGDRMLMYVNISRVFPQATNYDIQRLDSAAHCVAYWEKELEGATDGWHGYYVELRQTVANVFCAMSMAEAKAVVDRCNQEGGYKMKDLRKDLKEMSALVNAKPTRRF